MTKTQTLKRHEKIRRPSQYKAIISQGRRIQGEMFILYSRTLEGKDKKMLPRLGIVVSKRVLRQAHERARTKRLLREVFRRNKSGFKFPADVVFRLARKPKLFNFKEIEKECTALLTRCGLL